MPSCHARFKLTIAHKHNHAQAKLTGPVCYQQARLEYGAKEHQEEKERWEIRQRCAMFETDRKLLYKDEHPLDHHNQFMATLDAACL